METYLIFLEPFGTVNFTRLRYPNLSSQKWAETVALRISAVFVGLEKQPPDRRPFMVLVKDICQMIACQNGEGNGEDAK